MRRFDIAKTLEPIVESELETAYEMKSSQGAAKGVSNTVSRSEDEDTDSERTITQEVQRKQDQINSEQERLKPSTQRDASPSYPSDFSWNHDMRILRRRSILPYPLTARSAGYERVAFPWNEVVPFTDRQTAMYQDPQAGILSSLAQMQSLHNQRDPANVHHHTVEPSHDESRSTHSVRVQNQHAPAYFDIGTSSHVAYEKAVLAQIKTLVPTLSFEPKFKNHPFTPEIELAFTLALSAANKIPILQQEKDTSRVPMPENIALQRLFDGVPPPRPEREVELDLEVARAAVKDTSERAVALVNDMLICPSKYQKIIPQEHHVKSNTFERPSGVGYDGTNDWPDEDGSHDEAKKLDGCGQPMDSHHYNDLAMRFSASTRDASSNLASAASAVSSTVPNVFPFRPQVFSTPHALPRNSNNVSLPAPPTLPPSVEEAYRRKCIELAHRLSEVEQNNDELRLRRSRLVRGIRKMRLERAILLEALGKRMRKNGADGPLGNNDEDSEDSSESPPTVRAPTEDHHASPAQSFALTSRKPQERPLRTKKSHRRLPGSPLPGANSPAAAPDHSNQQQLAPSSIFSTPIAAAPIQNGVVEKGQPSSPSVSQAQLANSSLANTRPLTPREMFSRHLRKDVLPSNPNLAAEISASFDGDDKAYAEHEWRSLGNEERQRWHDKYEDAMREWTRAEDARKKERSQGYRRHRARGSRANTDDVEMAEAGDGEVAEEIL